MHAADSETLTADFVDNQVVLHFHLGTILCRRDGEQRYATLAEDVPGPVFDARPKLDPRLPETRHYLALLRYIHRDDTLVTKEVSVTLL